MRSNGRNEDGVALEGVIALRATERALLCLIPDGEAKRELWVPLSQITDDSEVFEEGHEGQLVVKWWFAEREGLA